MNDETLMLYYYRDGLSDAERRRVEASLERDASIRAQYEQLCNDLARLEAPEPTAVPNDMTARWHDSIDRAARAERQRVASPDRRFHFPSFAWGTGAAALLVAGIVIGLFISRPRPSEPIVAAAVPDAAYPGVRSPSDAFERGLQVYMRNTRQELARLPMDTNPDRAMLIMQMIRQNRLFERAAEHNEAEDLARVLRAFDFILVRLAADDITSEDAEALQSRLAFELDVMLTKLKRNASDVTGPI